MTGFFEAGGGQSLNVPASLTDQDHTLIQYWVSGAPELNVLFTNNQTRQMGEVDVEIGFTAGS